MRFEVMNQQNMKSNSRVNRPACWQTWLVVLLLTLAARMPVHAQTVVVSVVPARGATGVANNAQVVLTFSSYMDPMDTFIDFFDSFFSPVPVTTSWNNQFTILTCTPVTSWPAGSQIQWFLSGMDLFQEPVDDFGTFAVAIGGGGTENGGGTNLLTSFSLGALYSYEQTNAAPPFLQETAGCAFFAGTTLATNRTAHTVTVSTAPPMSTVQPLTFRAEGLFSFLGFANAEPEFEFAYPPGDYKFDVKSVQSNQQVTVSFALTQPPAPVLASFASVTNVNSTNSFLLAWNAFAGGTTADFIQVGVGNDFLTPDLGQPGALNGTAMSVTIPANTLAAGTAYEASISFYRYANSTNLGANYTAQTYRASLTSFTLTTLGTQVPDPVMLTKPGVTGGKFGFELTAPSGLTLTAQSSTSPSGPWTGFLTTNAPGGLMRITDPASPASGARYYRVIR
jgi:hypothetical protein